MPESPWGAIADTRVNKEIDLKNTKSKQEYFKKLEDFFSTSDNGQRLLNAKTRSWQSIREEMYSDSSAKQIIEQNEAENIEELTAKAERFEARRPARSRVPDERHTAKDTRPITSKNFRTWRHRPNKLDLMGIDTRRRMGRGKRGITARTFKKRNVYTRKPTSKR